MLHHNIQSTFDIATVLDGHLMYTVLFAIDPFITRGPWLAMVKDLDIVKSFFASRYIEGSLYGSTYSCRSVMV